jgi:hypothetical protein
MCYNFNYSINSRMTSYYFQVHVAFHTSLLGHYAIKVLEGNDAVPWLPEDMCTRYLLLVGLDYIVNLPCISISCFAWDTALDMFPELNFTHTDPQTQISTAWLRPLQETQPRGPGQRWTMSLWRSLVFQMNIALETPSHATIAVLDPNWS